MSAGLDGFFTETRARLSSVLRCEDFDCNDKEQFKTALVLATKVCKVSAKKIAEKFRVTEATVSRWITGEAFPGQFMRQSVMEWLASNLLEPIEKVPVS